MAVTRIVPNLPVADVSAANAFYAALFDLDIGMDLGWVGNVGPAAIPATQLNTLTQDVGASVNPVISIGVTDVDAVHERIVAAGVDIVHPLTDEPWGVRRFFFRDPDGNVINVVAHSS